MTLEEKRIKIAEAMGWHHIHYDGPDLIVGHPRSQKAPDIGPIPVPDYFNDLNACHEMLMAMPYEKEALYMHCLTYKIMMKDEGVSEFDKHMATPPQRAEAFGICLGLWKEGE